MAIEILNFSQTDVEEECAWLLLLFITGSNSFLALSNGMRAGWSQTRVAFMREIRLITAATKNSQIPQINMPQCAFLMCGDVLTDTVHLRVIWGNVSCPGGDLQDSVSKKCELKNPPPLIIWLTLLQCSFTTTSSQGLQWQGWHWRSHLKAKLRLV